MAFDFEFTEVVRLADIEWVESPKLSGHRRCR